MGKYVIRYFFNFLFTIISVRVVMDCETIRWIRQHLKCQEKEEDEEELKRDKEEKNTTAIYQNTKLSQKQRTQ